MTNTDAKLHLSLEDGIFEISGSEAFVSEQIENFKDIILEALKTKERKSVSAVSAEPLSVHSIAPASLTEINSEAGTGENLFPNVLHFEGKEVTIMKTAPGSSTAKQALNTVLIYLWAKKSVGEEFVPAKVLRDMLKDHSCLDEKNFSANLSKAQEHILIIGKKAGLKSYKLSRPGIMKAKELLESLDGE